MQMLLGVITVKLFYVIRMKNYAEISDNYAPEHLEVQAENLDWWLDKLKNLWIIVFR